MEKNFHEEDKKFHSDPESKKFVPTPIYPSVHFSFNEMEIRMSSSPREKVLAYELRTMLRVKHEGVWYGWKIMDTGIVPLDRANDTISYALTRFHTNIYLAQLYGKVDPSLCDGQGKPVFKPLADQREEKERLKELFRLPF